MLQVEILLRSERATVLLPTSLVGASGVRWLDNVDTLSKSASLTIPELQLQFRMNEYYMGMSIFPLKTSSTDLYLSRNVLKP